MLLYHYTPLAEAAHVSLLGLSFITSFIFWFATYVIKSYLSFIHSFFKGNTADNIFRNVIGDQTIDSLSWMLRKLDCYIPRDHASRTTRESEI